MALDPHLLLDAIHPAEPSTGYTVIGIQSGGRLEILYAEDPASGKRMAENLDRTAKFQGIFHLVPVLGRRPKTGMRGTEADAVACHAVYGDMDALDCAPLAERLSSVEKDAKNVVWNAATAEERAAALAACRAVLDDAVARGDVPMPSALVDSGRGLHPYWILESAARGADLARVKECNAAFASILRSDSCFDLARVLRTPGTSHRKNPKDVLRCELVEYSTSRHRLDDLLAFAARAAAGPLFAAPADGGTPARARRVTVEDPGPVADVAVPEAWRVYLAGDEVAQDSWHGRRTDLKDRSRSTYAFTVAVAAARGAGVSSVDELVAIMRDCPSCAGWVAEKPKQARKTAAKVLELTGRPRRDPSTSTTLTCDHDAVPAPPPVPGTQIQAPRPGPVFDPALVAVDGIDADDEQKPLHLPKGVRELSEDDRFFVTHVAAGSLHDPDNPIDVVRWKRIAECRQFRRGQGVRLGLVCPEHGLFNEIPLSCSNNNTCPVCARHHGLREADFVLNDKWYAGHWDEKAEKVLGEGIALVIFDAGPDGTPTEKRDRVHALAARYRKGSRRKDGIQHSYLACYPRNLPALRKRLDADGVAYTVMTHDPRGDRGLLSLWEIAHFIYNVHVEPSRLLRDLAKAGDREGLLDLMRCMKSKRRRTSGPRKSMPWYSEERARAEEKSRRDEAGETPADSTICGKKKEDGTACCRRGEFVGLVDERQVFLGGPGVSSWRGTSFFLQYLSDQRMIGGGARAPQSEPPPPIFVPRARPLVSSLLLC